MIKLVFENCEVMEIPDDIVETYSIQQTDTIGRAHNLVLVLEKCHALYDMKTQIYDDYRPDDFLRNPLARLCCSDISHFEMDGISYPLKYEPADSSWCTNILQSVTVTHNRVTIKVGIFD